MHAFFKNAWSHLLIFLQPFRAFSCCSRLQTMFPAAFSLAELFLLISAGLASNSVSGFRHWVGTAFKRTGLVQLSNKTHVLLCMPSFLIRIVLCCRTLLLLRLPCLRSPAARTIAPKRSWQSQRKHRAQHLSLLRLFHPRQQPAPLQQMGQCKAQAKMRRVLWS